MKANASDSLRSAVSVALAEAAAANRDREKAKEALKKAQA